MPESPIRVDSMGSADPAVRDEQSQAEIFSAEPELPAQLPPLMELLTSKVEAEFKPCLAASLFAPLAAHMSDYTYRYLTTRHANVSFSVPL